MNNDNYLEEELFSLICSALAYGEDINVLPVDEEADRKVAELVRRRPLKKRKLQRK